MARLDDLMKAGKPIYVRNNSNPMGKFVIVFSSQSGRKYEFLIPKTDVPLCISDVIPKNEIETSYELRTYVNKGLLVLLDSEEAEKELENPDTQEELRKLTVSEFSASNKFASQRVSAMKRIDIDEAQRLEKEFSTKNTSSDSGVINAWVKELMVRLESEDMSAKDATRELRIRQKELNNDDLTYVVLNANKEQIKDFAKKVLADRQQSTEKISEEPLTEEEKRLEAEAKQRQKV